MTPKVKLELKNVSMKYMTVAGETPALAEINITVAEGEFVSIVGPSGCGKSTLLSLISGLLKPTAGEVLIDGQPVTGPSTKTGYMLQSDYLFEWRTIWQNVVLGLEIRGRLSAGARNKVESLLADYGLRDFRHYYPRQLSGGMRQRVALIRTLAVDPEILLLDEPFAALDYQTRLYLEEEMTNILRRANKTVILVTHDIAEAISMADRIVILSKRPATVKKELPIELTCDRRTPLKTREAPEFRAYFKTVWEELDVHV